jgi:hypothetical protein
MPRKWIGHDYRTIPSLQMIAAKTVLYFIPQRRNRKKTQEKSKKKQEKSKKKQEKTRKNILTITIAILKKDRSIKKGIYNRVSLPTGMRNKSLKKPQK